MSIREQFRKRLEAALEYQRPLAPKEHSQGDERWRGEREIYRREVEAMAPILAAVEDIRQTAYIRYQKDGPGALNVEGLPIHVRITNTKVIYLFGERPDVKRYLTLDDALDALIEHIVQTVARRWDH